jgi:spoIIIJ-associated protein
LTEDKNMDDALDMFVESLEEEQRSDKLIEDNSKRRVNKKKDEVEINGLEKIKSILKKSIELICIGEEVKISTDPGELKLSVHGSDLGIAIGKDGKNIQALEYIINLIGKRKKLVDRNVMIDIKDYRKKRVEKIKKMALITAKKAVTEGRKITLQPMCAYERKVIHNVLAEIKNVKTRSVYEEPNRRIMIYPVRTSSK